MNFLNGLFRPTNQPLEIVGNAKLADSEIFRNNDHPHKSMYDKKFAYMTYRFAGEKSNNALRHLNVDIINEGWLPATIKWEDNDKVARHLGIEEDLPNLDNRISQAVGIPSAHDGVTVVPYGNHERLKFEARFEQPTQKRIHVTVNYDKYLSNCAKVANAQHYLYNYEGMSLEDMHSPVNYLDVEEPPLHHLPE